MIKERVGNTLGHHMGNRFDNQLWLGMEEIWEVQNIRKHRTTSEERRARPIARMKPQMEYRYNYKNIMVSRFNQTLFAWNIRDRLQINVGTNNRWMSRVSRTQKRYKKQQT